MGKSNQHKMPGITTDNAHPGCMWGAFHILKYHHWSHVKRRFPHKKRLENKDGVEWSPGNICSASDPRKMQEHSDSLIYDGNVEEQMKTSSPANKKSLRARIKARISEEISKKKGRRHHRSSTCPVQLNRSNPANHIVSQDEHPLSKTTATDISLRTTLQEDGDSSTPGPQNKVSTYRNQNISGVIRRQNSHVGEHAKQANENMFLQEDDSNKKIEQILIEAKEVALDASLKQPNDFLDSNDIMNIHKELYAKILHDPGSPLAHNFHNHRAQRANIRFGKSGTFPLPASDRRDVKPSKLNHDQEGSTLKEEDRKAEGNNQAQFLSKENHLELSALATETVPEDLQNTNKKMDENTNNLHSASVRPSKKQNHRVKKRFKDLRKKVRHMIKESKNEKNPITMDAILHKIPHGQMSSEEARDDVLNRLNDTAAGIIGSDNEDDAASSPGKEKQSIRRTESLSKSLNKYRQLYESSFRKDSTQSVSEKLKLKREDTQFASSVSKSFGRILSLPNLKYYLPETEDSSVPLSPWRVDKTTADGTVYSDRNSLIPLDGYQLAFNGNSLGSSAINRADTEVEDLTDYCAGEHKSDEEDMSIRGELREPNADPDFHKDESSSAIYSVSEDLETNPLCLPHEVQDFLVSQHPGSSMVISEMDDNRVKNDRLKFLSRQTDSSLLHVQVDVKDTAEFDYVRDVLDLSGFSRNEFLGMWYSDDQPVDPSVFGEVGGCLFHDPNCLGNEEGGNCSHLLLFDLINHVLMEIYERSFTYYPRPLSSLSRVHPMPVGYHVLEEVWALVSWYMSYRPEFDQSLDYISSRDMMKNDGWMNLQYDTECVGLELEDMIFDDLLDETLDLVF